MWLSLTASYSLMSSHTSAGDVWHGCDSSLKGELPWPLIPEKSRFTGDSNDNEKKSLWDYRLWPCNHKGALTAN